MKRAHGSLKRTHLYTYSGQTTKETLTMLSLDQKVCVDSASRVQTERKETRRGGPSTLDHKDCPSPW
ncbi:hypothetical protein NHX12_025808 [Muraenolepis orangiensis]|uniref:Uncharacterized protein n=1 Tax=Muraenolepis orangiensis TaxID=630683 RepID=A0A9Q0EL11_9TELE|nr:hypothetical protein NHX12_025808 [Muraenolepis orangiensis]